MRKPILYSLIASMLVLGGVAIYFGIQLAQQSQDNTTLTGLPNTGSYTFPTACSGTYCHCSGHCNSGKDCNGNGNPPAGSMWSCYFNKDDTDSTHLTGQYDCAYDSINNGDNAGGCYLSCYTGNKENCNCDIGTCKARCLNNLPPGQNSGTYSMECPASPDGCGQRFTCDCNRSTPTTPVVTTPAVTTPVVTTPVVTTPVVTTPVVTTPVVTTPVVTTPVVTTPVVTTPVVTTPVVTTPVVTTPIITKPVVTTPISTKPVVTTPVVTITPPKTTVPATSTIPHTALISDSADRAIIGGLLIFIGILFLRTGWYQELGQILFGSLNLKWFNKITRKTKKQKMESERSEFEDRF